MPKYDAQAVRTAADGRWPEILQSLAGLDAGLFDGKEAPCPKCGGETRWRWNAEKQFGICSQCFQSKNGDGFAALMWLKGIEFPQALEEVAGHLGVPAVNEKAVDKDLKWQEWAPGILPYFIQKRPGITEESLLANGARMAKYKNTYAVIALPIVGSSLDVSKPVGYVLMDQMGGKLPVWNRSGEITDWVKNKTIGTSGLIGIWGVERLKLEGLPELVWKVEGVSDLLTAWSIIPEDKRERHLVLSNASGAGEKPGWMASALARGITVVLHDADESGQVGLKRWGLAIAKQGVECRTAQLPYDIVPTKGKDLRDWILEGNDYQAMLNLPVGCQTYRPPEEGDAPHADETAMHELILKKLQLEVLYEQASGQVQVFSLLLKKSSTLIPEKLSKPRLISAAGLPAIQHVSSDPNGTSTWSLRDVQEALAIAGATRRSTHNERGVGVWEGENNEGHRALVVANNTHAALWNGEEVLRHCDRPSVAGLMLNFGDEASVDWYDYDQLAEYTARAKDSATWRESAINQSVDLFRRWRWESEADPELVTGLVLASWIQTIWKWRPQVMITGESNSGKSTLFQCLGGVELSRGLFGDLKFKTSKCTEAGMRQGLGLSARVPLLDEFERSKDREAILQSLRSSSRGDVVVKGTADQRGKAFRLQHIAWCAAIESGLDAQADQNRFVVLNLLAAERSKQNLLSLPGPVELAELGVKLLAISIVHGLQAMDLAQSLKSIRIDGAGPRFVETYSVPAAILAASLGYSQAQAEELLRALMAGVLGRGEADSQSDQESLLEAILMATVRCGTDGDLTVTQILSGKQTSQGLYTQNLEACGVRELEDGSLAINRKQACEKLLRGTEWQRARIDQVLKRIPGVVLSQVVRVAGRTLRCIVIPAAAVESASATVTPSETQIETELRALKDL